MKRATWIVGVLTAVALTAVSGVLQGRLTHRWDDASDLKAVAARLDVLRGDVGPWKLRKARELTPQVFSTLQCAGYVFQDYVNSNTGENVSVVLLLGPPGPISVHTPEICYSGAAYAIESEREAVTIRAGDTEHSAWMTRFRGIGVESDALTVYYAWSDGGRWQAAAQPRVTFAGQPYLYKLQLAVPGPPVASRAAADTGRSFLNAFLPAFERAQAAGRPAITP